MLWKLTCYLVYLISLLPPFLYKLGTTASMKVAHHEFFIPYSKANFPLKENFTVVTVMLICNLSFPRLHNFLVFVKTIAPSGIRLDDCHASDWGLHARMLLKSVWLMEKACRLDNSCFLDYTWHYNNFLTLMKFKGILLFHYAIFTFT